MRMVIHNVVATLALCVITETCIGQPLVAQIKAQAKSTQSTIKLRWAPTSASLWKACNKYGYTIERTEISLGKQLIENPKSILLTPQPIRPSSEKDWLSNMEDDYVAIAAQALFGESFDARTASTIAQKINAANELESRFAFALHAADISPTAAKLSGLYFEDEHLAPGVKYLYKIYANAPVINSDTAAVLIGLSDYFSLPQVRQVDAAFGDRVVMIQWNERITARFYSSFWVERSRDGILFERITTRPVINTFDETRRSIPYFFKSDSLPSNNVKFYYRVSGIDAFGDLGPPSDTVAGHGEQKLSDRPTIVNITSEFDSLTVDWDFPTRSENLITHFDIVSSASSPSFDIVRSNISPTGRRTRILQPVGARYLSVRAVSHSNGATESFPFLVQPEDSIPPSPPEHLEGKIDSAGRIVLSWSQSQQHDLNGYIVFRSNFKTENEIQRSAIISENTFVDSTKMNSLNGFVYYSVIAVDNHFNMSRHSETLRLRLPDMIRPTSALLTDAKADSTGVKIKWIRSASEDVIKYAIYRRESVSDDFTFLGDAQAGDTTFMDEAVIDEQTYQYAVVSVDASDLESEPSMSGHVLFRSVQRRQMSDVYYKLDVANKSVTVSWRNESDLKRINVYKSTNGQPLRFVGSIQNGRSSFEDAIRLDDNVIEYQIIGILRNGIPTEAKLIRLQL